MDYSDPAPKRIRLQDWSEQFRRMPGQLIQEYHYCQPAGSATHYPWSTYLFPPAAFACYGARHLRRLQFDNSLAALRMWGFVMTETERLFRARQIGKRVIACMGDLGGTPPLALAAGNTVPFYPDCIWWVPFMNESSVLFDAAARAGIGESACYSRAALGAFVKQSYFPRPALCIAGTGASCDDYSSVEQLVEKMGFPVFWLELPLRKDCGLRNDERGMGKADSGEKFTTTPAGTPYQESALKFLTAQFRSLRRQLDKTLGGTISDDSLRASIGRVNRVRRLVREVKQLVHSAPASIFPALEMMVIEFGNLHFYSDIDEWTAILEHVLATLRRRINAGQSLGAWDALRVVWAMPPADPLLLSYAEDLGLRVVGTEYVINQALDEIPDTGDPVAALAETFLNASLIGSSHSRAERVIEQAREFRAEGLVITGVLGGSHCATETNLIRDYVTEELDLPVLALDVPSPSSMIQGQIKTRMEAFVEVLKGRR